MSIEIKTLLDYEKVDYSKENDVHLLVRVEGKKNKDESRKPVNIVVVLDMSGSMEGDKFAYAVKSVEELVQRLSAEDYLSIVGFETEARVISSPMSMTNSN